MQKISFNKKLWTLSYNKNRTLLPLPVLVKKSARLRNFLFTRSDQAKQC